MRCGVTKHARHAGRTARTRAPGARPPVHAADRQGGGGEPGAAGENWLLRGGDEAAAERLPDKCTVELGPGDVLRLLTPGGGGWGAPR